MKPDSRSCTEFRKGFGMKKIVAALMVLVFLLTAAPSKGAGMADREREQPTGAEVVIDLVITRPLGLVATAAGTAIFIVALPFTIPSKSVKLSARKLIADPFNYTFRRPLGEIDDYNDY